MPVVIAGICVLAIESAFAEEHELEDDSGKSEISVAIEKAIRFLEEHVASWPAENGCYSCHNNSDAALALLKARKLGWFVKEKAMEDTLDWLAAPDRWGQQKGDPNVSDQALADLQFTYALGEAIAADLIFDKGQVLEAAQLLMAHQSPEGDWIIEDSDALGSPAAPGNALATFKAWNFLSMIENPILVDSHQKAERRLLKLVPQSVTDHAVQLLLLAKLDQKKSPQVAELLLDLIQSQTSHGGWGPYAQRPAENFDTSLAVLALIPYSGQVEVLSAVDQGVSFLLKEQLEDGSWGETTRPSGGESYAQWISTSAWAAIALLEYQSFSLKKNGLDERKSFIHRHTEAVQN